MTRALRLVSGPVAVPDFADFYRKHFDFVWCSLSRLGVLSAELPDAVQEVFVVASKRYHELDFSTRLTTWLYATCLRVASDRRRRLKNRREVSYAEPAHELGGHAVAEQSEAELQRLLASALDTLPLEQRAVFTLFELDGLTGEAIAELLELPLGTVFSRLRLARQRFRAALASNESATGGEP
jgi:RNA polymerase sigma-70 factor (ECF subfamily)